MNEPRSPQSPPGAGRPTRPSAPRPQGARATGGGGGNPTSPRAEFIPEKKGAPPALTIGLLGAIVVAAGVFGWAMLKRQEIEARPAIVTDTDNKDEWAGIKKKIPEARRRFQETMALRTDETKKELFAQKLEETIEFISSIRDEIDVMLDGVRDPQTGQLPPEYLGYNHDAKDLVMMLSDLSKATPFGIESEGGGER